MTTLTRHQTNVLKELAMDGTIFRRGPRGYYIRCADNWGTIDLRNDTLNALVEAGYVANYKITPAGHALVTPKLPPSPVIDDCFETNERNAPFDTVTYAAVKAAPAVRVNATSPDGSRFGAIISLPTAVDIAGQLIHAGVNRIVVTEHKPLSDDVLIGLWKLEALMNDPAPLLPAQCATTLAALDSDYDWRADTSYPAFDTIRYETPLIRAIRHDVLHRVPQSINVHAPRPVPCCAAADPMPVHGAWDCYGTKPMYGPEPSTEGHKDAEGCFGTPPAGVDPTPYKYAPNAYLEQKEAAQAVKLPASKRILTLVKDGPAFDVDRQHELARRAALSNTALTVGKTSAGKAAYQR